MVRCSESTEISIDFLLKPGTFNFIVAPSSSCETVFVFKLLNDLIDVAKSS